MGADPEHGRRRPCSRDCCQPNTRAQEREAVRRDIDSDMPATVVTVTRAEVEAAKMLVERARETGKPIDPAIRLIAEASPPTR